MICDITKTILAAAVFAYFCVGMSIANAQTEIPCDHTVLTKGGKNQSGEWRIFAIDTQKKGPHLPVDGKLTISYDDTLPNDVDILYVEATNTGNAKFPKEKWVGRCVREPGETSYAYVLVGDMYVESGVKKSQCRHRVVIKRTTELAKDPTSQKIPPGQILVKSETSHSPPGSGCSEHITEPHDRAEVPEATIHLGHAQGGND